MAKRSWRSPWSPPFDGPQRRPRDDEDAKRQPARHQLSGARLPASTSDLAQPALPAARTTRSSADELAMASGIDGIVCSGTKSPPQESLAGSSSPRCRRPRARRVRSAPPPRVRRGCRRIDLLSGRRLPGEDPTSRTAIEDPLTRGKATAKLRRAALGASGRRRVRRRPTTRDLLPCRPAHIGPACHAPLPRFAACPPPPR